MRNVNIDLLSHQEDFVFSESKYPAIVGGLGSGKTKAGTMRAVIKLIEKRGNNCGVFLPTYDLINLRAIPGVEEDLEVIGLDYKTNKSEYRIDVKGFGFIIFRSYDRPERIVAFDAGYIAERKGCEGLAKDHRAHPAKYEGRKHHRRHHFARSGHWRIHVLGVG